MFQVLLFALLALLIGAAFCFAGYRFFRVLIFLWGFFVGLSITAQGVAAIAGTGFLATALGWLAGIIVGLALGGLAYFFYIIAIVILGASVGYWIGTGLVAALGLGHIITPTIIGIVFAIILALITITTSLPRLLIIVLTAFGGASTILSGILLLLGRIPLNALQYGGLSAISRVSWIWFIAWLVLAFIGLNMQWKSTQYYEEMAW